ncbi:MAG: WecB/TagA/CpsF family glycosyltransferase [Tissierellia bacterium]|nr:WecB/TagA/CpsF family glycosyltransferase [Tissierellia bacterium]
MEKISIFGVEIFNTTLEETMKIVSDFLDGEDTKVGFTPNTEIVMACRDDLENRKLVNSADLVVPDGIGLIYASKIHKKPLKERVTGFDISMNILKMGREKPIKLYLLGGKDGIAKMAKANIERDYEGIEVVGYHHGYFKGSQFDIYDDEKEQNIIEEINELKPDVIFVGFGFPRQEKWIAHNRDILNTKFLIGNGGVIDILAGVTKETPKIFVKLNLEWFYRLIKQPSRIIRQIALPKFLISVLINKDSVKLEGDVNEQR